MAARGSSATAAGLVLTMTAAGAGVRSTGGFALLISFTGMLAGAILVFVGVRMADDDPTAHTGRPGVVAGAGVRCLHRNLGLVGLLLASIAATATANRETGPVLSFCLFLLLLLGLSLLNVGLLLLGEQEQ